MIELSNVTFESQTLPSEWAEELHECTFERGALRSRRVAILRVPVPGNGWRALRVEMEVEPIGGALLACGDGTLTTVIDIKRARHRVAFCSVASLAESVKTVPRKDGPHLVAFEFDNGRFRALVDGQELIADDDPRPTAVSGMLEIALWDDCLLHRALPKAGPRLFFPVVWGRGSTSLLPPGLQSGRGRIRHCAAARDRR